MDGRLGISHVQSYWFISLRFLMYQKAKLSTLTLSGDYFSCFHITNPAVLETVYPRTSHLTQLSTLHLSLEPKNNLLKILKSLLLLLFIAWSVISSSNYLTAFYHTFKNMVWESKVQGSITISWKILARQVITHSYVTWRAVSKLMNDSGFKW
jgi:hypothetical protein